jgi:hypothetical protein
MPYRDLPLRCPECGAGMPVLVFLTDAVVAILRHFDLPRTAPPLTPPRSPPPRARPEPTLRSTPIPPLDLDQAAAFDPIEPNPIPEFNPDQSRRG